MGLGYGAELEEYTMMVFQAAFQGLEHIRPGVSGPSRIYIMRQVTEETPRRR